MEEIFKSGIVDDPRTTEEKEKDYTIEEVASSFKAPVWKEKKQPNELQFSFRDDTWRRFPERDQDGSSRCVMETGAKLLGIDNWIEEGEFAELSSKYGYSFRINRSWGSGEGMVGDDALQILTKRGLPFEGQVPSNGIGEAESNAYVPKKSHEQVAQVFRAGGYGKFQTREIDRIASVIQNTGKGVMAWFRWDGDEYTDVPFLKTGSTLAYHHSVSLIDPILYNGKKAFVIDESWGKNISKFGAQRIITEDFFLARNTFAAQTLDLRNDWRDNPAQVIPIPKPKHTFLQDLQFSPVYNVDNEVKKLQEILRYEGFFPTTVNGQPIEITGYYGAITAKAVLEFQQKHSVASTAELILLQGKKVGPKTRVVLNELYA